MILDKIRSRHRVRSVPKMLAFTFLALLSGFGLGMLSEFVAGLNASSVPNWLEAVNIRGFFTTLMPSAFGLLIVALFSHTPIRAALNSLAFFVGLLLGYYIYFAAVIRTLPDWNSMGFWLIFAAISPLIGAVCWYGRGKGTVAGFIAAFILAFWFLQAFRFTPTFQGFGLNLSYWFIPLILLAAAIGMLWRRPLQILFSTIGGFLIAYIYILLPFSIPYV